MWKSGWDGVYTYSFNHFFQKCYCIFTWAPHNNAPGQIISLKAAEDAKTTGFAWKQLKQMMQIEKTPLKVKLLTFL